MFPFLCPDSRTQFTEDFGSRAKTLAALFRQHNVLSNVEPDKGYGERLIWLRNDQGYTARLIDNRSYDGSWYRHSEDLYNKSGDHILHKYQMQSPIVFFNGLMLTRIAHSTNLYIYADPQVTFTLTNNRLKGQATFNGHLLENYYQQISWLVAHNRTQLRQIMERDGIQAITA